MQLLLLKNFLTHISHSSQSRKELCTIIALLIVYLNIKRSLSKFSSLSSSTIMIGLLQPLDLWKEGVATHDNGLAPVSPVPSVSKPPASPAANLHAIVLAFRAITVLKTASTSATTRIKKTTSVDVDKHSAVSLLKVHPGMLAPD